MLDRLEWIDLDAGVDDGVFADEALVAEHHALLHAGAAPQVAGPAHHCPAQAHPRAQVDVVVHNGAFNEAIRTDAHIRSQHGVLRQPGACFHAAVVPDDGRAVHGSRRIDL